MEGREILEPGIALESSLGGQGHFWGNLRAGTGAFWGQKIFRHGKDGPRTGKLGCHWLVGGRNGSLSLGSELEGVGSRLEVVGRAVGPRNDNTGRQ